MTEAARLWITVGSDIGAATRGLSQIDRGVERVSGNVQRHAGLIERAVGTGLGFIGANVIMGATAKAADFLSGSLIGMNSQLEQSQIAFTQMTGSAEAANDLLDDIQRFAAKTPFEFPELLQSARLMKAWGFETRELLPWLHRIGDTVSAFGGGSVQVDMITRALGQMRGIGRVTAQDMMQLANQGIPAWRILAEEMGMTVAQVRKLSEEGKIGADVFLRAFSDFAAANFGGMMEQQSHTFAGAMSTIKDSVQIAIAGAFKPAFEAVSDLADRLGQFVSSDQFFEWSDRVARGTQTVVDALGRIPDVLAFIWRSLAAGRPQDIFRPILDSIERGTDDALAYLRGWGRELSAAGYGAMVEYANGIIMGGRSAVAAAVEYVASIAGQFLIGASPPPMGPLSGVDAGGQAVIEAWAEGASRADLGAFADIAERAAGHLKRLEGASGGVETAIYNIDRAMGELDRSTYRVRREMEAIEDSFAAQLDPLRGQAEALTDTLSSEDRQRQIALELEEIELRKQRLAALGNDEAVKAIDLLIEANRNAQEAISLEEQRQALMGEAAAIPLEDQIKAIEAAQEAALEPLREQLEVYESQADALGEQRRAWGQIKTAIDRAVKAATPKKGKGAAGADATLMPTDPFVLEPGADLMAIMSDTATGAGEAAGRSLGEGFAGGFRASIEANMPAVVGTALGAVVGLFVGGPIGATLGSMIGSFLGGKIGEGLKGEQPTIDAAMAGLFADPGAALETVSGQLTAALAPIGQEILDWIATTAGAIPGAMAAWIPAFFSWTGDALPQVGTKLGELAAAVVDGIVGAVPLIADAVHSWLPSFVDWIGADLLPSMLDALAGLVEGVKNFIGDGTTVAKVVENLVLWAGAFVGWVLTELIPAVVDAFWKLPSQIAEFLIDVGPDIIEGFFNLGKGIVEGIINGLGGLLDSLREAIFGPIDAVLGEGRTEASRAPARRQPGSASYAVGTNFVPEDQFAFLHRGEAVIPADLNEAMQSGGGGMAGSGGGGGPVVQQITVLFQGPVFDPYGDFTQRFAEALRPALARADGRAGA
jgi:tape measure domain-containing protein